MTKKRRRPQTLGASLEQVNQQEAVQKAVQEPNETKKPKDGDPVWVVSYYSTGETLCVGTEEPSKEFPYGRWLRRKEISVSIRKGKIQINVSRYAGTTTIKSYMGMTAGEYSFPSHATWGGTIESFLSEEEAVKYSQSIPRFHEGWIENSPPEPEEPGFFSNGFGRFNDNSTGMWDWD